MILILFVVALALRANAFFDKLGANFQPKTCNNECFNSGFEKDQTFGGSLWCNNDCNDECFGAGKCVRGWEEPNSASCKTGEKLCCCWNPYPEVFAVEETARSIVCTQPNTEDQRNCVFDVIVNESTVTSISQTNGVDLSVGTNSIRAGDSYDRVYTKSLTTNNQIVVKKDQRLCSVKAAIYKGTPSKQVPDSVKCQGEVTFTAPSYSSCTSQSVISRFFQINNMQVEQGIPNGLCNAIPLFANLISATVGLYVLLS